MSAPAQSGLYIVATPIGNLGDLSRRAEETLAAADIILVEDTRVTGKLLNHIGKKSRMMVYNDHKSASDREAILDAVRCKIVALVSDAGTPLISDPGYKLVRDAQAAGLYVTTIPGPSAAIAALTLSGLPSDRFLFEGFLPSKTKARTESLAALKTLNASLIFYENGSRLGAMLADSLSVLGDRKAAVVREITKRFEEAVTGSLSELSQRYGAEKPKGEIVVIIGPPGAPEAASDEEIEAALREAMVRLPASKAAGEVARMFNTDRKALYELTNRWKSEK
ncbi:16S rRNA (cytidine(1402)-2'-O)-methyltransferase [Parasphingorhabdus flavimaris]|jgi:16S rRNA (cytidine1402-2'-O)-methyltransferase|uniref:Ribosomal RNA small subunit methyltransferase I n=1 Tax=Parasphingorhabdus flavimaris TaxID=266812 RepID=A0ABX2MZ65_9SPHN|nr:16S rRNA (cytidine(1402)-2'-O)-methyltransferase [Parasphingorhabdus flavimaris]NVD26719.1 16S rRNA (cytidine(1402)-2'-O)-methyltransferase [Parasphingorhabdus flavimaris]|tara:strand:+ start:4638 stop:5477 length:840 start_codon:yes stop_codon:yes gene_type:complete